MTRVPTVNELVEAALEDSASLEGGDPPSQKIAATVGDDRKPDRSIMEETALELEDWADKEEKQSAEVEKLAAAEKVHSRHDTILKLAMATTTLKILRDLDEHGQLGHLVEKNAFSSGLTGRERVLQLLKQ